MTELKMTDINNDEGNSNNDIVVDRTSTHYLLETYLAVSTTLPINPGP